MMEKIMSDDLKLNDAKGNGDSPINATPYQDLNNGSGELYCDQQGLTKREYFAGLAMQGHLANSSDDMIAYTPEQVAKFSVDYTDALLKELDK